MPLKQKKTHSLRYPEARSWLNLGTLFYLLLYSDLMFWLAHAQGVFFGVTASFAVFCAAFGAGEKNLFKNMVPALFLLVLSLLTGVLPGISGKSIYLFQVMLLLSFLAVMVFLYARDGAEEPVLDSILIYRKSGPVKTAVKTAAAAGLGMAGYFFMDKQVYFLSFLMYAGCFAALVSIFQLEKTARTAQKNGSPEWEGAVPDKISAKISALFCMGAAVLLAVRAYNSIMAYKTMEPLMYAVMAAFFAGLIPGFGAGPREQPADDKKLKIMDAVTIVLFFGVALYLNTKDIRLLPYGMYTDDMYHFLKTAETLSANGRIPVFYSDMPILAASLPYWLIAQVHNFLKIGLSVVSIRYFYAFFGAFSVIFVYLAAREIFNRRTAVLAVFLHSFMLYQMIISRATEHFSAVPFFTAGAVYFFFVASRKGGPVYFILSGIMTALGMYFYNAAKLVPFIFVLYFLISIIIGVKKNNYILSRLRGFLLLTLAALITFYPLITYILSPGSNYLGRVSGMSFQGTLLNAQQFFQYFPAQVSTSIAGIFRDSGAFGISSLPSGNLLDPVSAILLILGTAVTASLWKRPKYLFMIAWLAAGLSGIIFAVHFDKVYVHRAGSVMPALVILMAMALDFMATAFEKIFGKPGRLTTPVILGVLLFPIAFTSVNNYFTVYKNDPAVRFFRNSILQRAADFVESDKNRNVFFSAGFSGEKFDKLLVMLPRLKYPEGFTDVSLPDFGRIYNDKKKDVVIIAEGLYDTFMPVYREYFPDAVIKKHWYPDYWLFEDAEGFKKLYGWNDPDYIVNSIRTASLFTGDHAKPQVGFVSCEIPYGDIEALYGFHACYYRAGKQVSEGKLMNGETPAAVPFDKLVLSGMMDVPVTGEYSFYAEGCEAVEFAIAGIPVKKGRVKLLRGLNPVRIVLGHIGGSLNIAWLKPDNGGKQEKIPAGNVIDSKKLFGLLYKTVLNGKILYEMRDYSVNNRIYYSRVFNRTPYNITEPLYSRGIIYCERVWDGFINIAENGYYSFMDKCVNDCAVVIDGRKAYENKQYTRMPGGEMFLTRGKHRFHLSQHYSVGDDCDYSLILYKKTEWKAPVDVTYDMLSMQ